MKRLLLITVLLMGWVHVAQADEVDDLLFKGEKLVSYGKLAAAESKFREALKLSPGNVTAIQALAQVTEFQEKWVDAALFYTSYYYLDREFLFDPEEPKKKLEKLGQKIYRGGIFTLRVTPGEAEMYINGLPVGKGQVILPVGPDIPYTVTAKLKDYHKHTPQTLTFSDHEEREHTIRLRKIVYKGTVKFKLYPADNVSIYVDAKKVVVSEDSIEVVEGRHLVCFQKEGYDRWWRSVTVPRNGEVFLETQLRDTTRPDEPCDIMPDDF